MLYKLGLRFRLGNKFGIGPVFGYSPERTTKDITTPVINNFYGQGKENVSSYFLGVNMGVDLGNFVLNLEGGPEFENKNVNENILRANGQVVSSNTDNYSKANPRFAAGLDYLVNKKFGVGVNAGHNTRNFFYGGKLVLRF